MLILLNINFVCVFLFCLQEWGKSGDLHNLGIKWHIPNQQEKDFTEHILQAFLLTELKRTKLHCDGEAVMSRQVCCSEVSDVLYSYSASL